METVILIMAWDKMRLNMIMQTHMNLVMPLLPRSMMLVYVSDLIMPLMLCITYFDLQVWTFMHETLA